MLKDEAFYFIRLGTHLERADNTARIIDVKFHGAGDGDEGEQAGQDAQRDFYYWAAILRSVSAFEIYRKVYRDVITPARVAELLMLRPDMPRSLMGCMEEVVSNLQTGLQRQLGRHRTLCRPPARAAQVRLDRRHPGRRPARLPGPLPGRHQRAGKSRQPRLPAAAGSMTP